MWFNDAARRTSLQQSSEVVLCEGRRQRVVPLHLQRGGGGGRRHSTTTPATTTHRPAYAPAPAAGCCLLLSSIFLLPRRPAAALSAPGNRAASREAGARRAAAAAGPGSQWLAARWRSERDVGGGATAAAGDLDATDRTTTPRPPGAEKDAEDAQGARPWPWPWP